MAAAFTPRRFASVRTSVSITDAWDKRNSMMKFSGINQTQLVTELKLYRVQLQGDVEFFAVNVGWHGRAKLDAVKAELRAVCEFIVYLVESGANADAPNIAHYATARVRCPHYKAIRHTFAIAKDRGLNMKDKPVMRAAFARAFARALDRTIASRDEMNGGNWDYVVRQMHRGSLAW